MTSFPRFPFNAQTQQISTAAHPVSSCQAANTNQPINSATGAQPTVFVTQNYQPLHSSSNMDSFEEKRSGQLFQGSTFLKDHMKVTFSATATTQSISNNSVCDDHQGFSDRLIVIPKIQNFDQKLQFSVDFQLGNQKQSINFDLDIRNLILEKYSELLANGGGQLCSSCQYSPYSQQQQSQQQQLSHQKLRKLSCSSDLSDVTMLNEPNHLNACMFNCSTMNQHFPSSYLLSSSQQQSQQSSQSFQSEQHQQHEEFMDFQSNRIQNYQNCKIEESEQKSVLKPVDNNINQQFQLINNTSSINHQNSSSSSVSHLLDSLYTQTLPSSFLNQEQTSHSILQQPGSLTLIQNKNERNAQDKVKGSAYAQDQSSIQYSSNIGDLDIFSIVKDQLGFSDNSGVTEQSTSICTKEGKFTLETPLKKVQNKPYSSVCFSALTPAQIAIQEKDKEENDNDEYASEENESQMLLDGVIDDINYTKEYLAKAEKKNVVKNFVKAFKSYLNEVENRNSIMELLQMVKVKELDTLKQRFSSYLKKKKFNNKLIKDLLINPSYNKVFKSWLLNHARDWLYIQSKVENKQSHFIMLKYFISCIDEPGELDKLKVLKNTKKLALSQPQIAPFSTSLEQQPTHYHSSAISNQNTYTHLDSEFQINSQIHPISISNFTVLPLNTPSQLNFEQE